MHHSHHPVRDTDEPREPQESADPRRWKALAAIALAQFMLILDLTVVNVALPDLGGDLDLSRAAFTWAVSIYGLVFGGLLLLGGRLADVFGARPMILTGLVIFTLASLVTGLAQNETVLLGGRVGQGAGAPLLSPAALAAITSIFHGEERNKALSVWASLGGVGFTAGVLIGGILTSGPGWRWVFFINVPVGIVRLAAIRAVVPLRRHPDRATRVDVLGAVTVTAATGSFIYGMITAGRLVGRTGTRPVAVVVLALVAIGNALLIGVSADGNVYAEALPGVVVFALGGGSLFVCATTTALGRVGLHEAGLVSGIVNTFNQLGAAICVAVASSVAAVGLTRTPSIDGFTDAFTVFTIAAAVAAVLSLRLVPPGK